MKLSPAMEDALKGARALITKTDAPWLSYLVRGGTISALERRGLCHGFQLTPAGIAERERLLK